MNVTPARAREIADTIDAYDADLKILQDSKRDTFAGFRAELEACGFDKATVKAEVAALKSAIAKRAKRRIDATAADESEALAEMYLEAIDGNAPRATHAIAHSMPTIGAA